MSLIKSISFVYNVFIHEKIVHFQLNFTDKIKIIILVEVCVKKSGLWVSEMGVSDETNPPNLYLFAGFIYNLKFFSSHFIIAFFKN